MHRRADSESGYAMLSVLLLAMVAGGIVLVMSLSSLGAHRLAQNRLHHVQAHYLAEGSVEIAKRAIQDAAALGTAPSGVGSASVDGVAVPYTISPVGSPSVETDPSGLQTTIQSYQIVATATVGKLLRAAYRIVNARTTPIFQYAVFYEQSLDILPYPDMTVTGRIHTNGDLRVGSGAGTLTLNSNLVRAVGTLRRFHKETGAPTGGTVRIRKWVEDPLDGSEPVAYEEVESLSQMAGEGLSTTSGYDSLFTGYDANADGTYDTGAGDWLPFDAGVVERYGPPVGYSPHGNSLLLGAHGVTRVKPPTIGDMAMFETASGGDYEWDSLTSEYVLTTPGTGTHKRGHYHALADLSIIVSADGLSWTAYDVNGTDVSSAVSAAVTLDNTYDKRQGGYVRVVKVDVATLNTNGFPANHLLYVSHYGMSTGTLSKGVHLVNGSQVAYDLTVVTEGSAYIQGDFNTSTPVSAAVIADAINLLSNSWVNGTSMPTASSTTYNVALISGNTETLNGVYNGGIENYPRFHEAWSGQTCTVVGSMVSSWENQYATGPFSGAQYNPPTRNFSFDTRFNDVTKLPKFTPKSTEVVDVVRW